MFCVNNLTGRTTSSFSLERQHALVRLLAPVGLTHTFDSSYLRGPNFGISDCSDPERDSLGQREGELASRQRDRLLQDTLLRDQRQKLRGNV